MLRFDFYGCIVEVSGDCRPAVDEVGRDFAWFIRPEAQGIAGRAPDVRVVMHGAPPPYDGLPALPARVFTPRNVTFKHGDTSYVDYFGRGLAVLSGRDRLCEVYASEADMLREIVFLFLLSRVGQHLDAIGLHRIHALGGSYKGRGILLLLPSGGGKSTLAFDLLRDPNFLLLSEDTPLIDRAGRIHPFPLRLGLKTSSSSDVPAHMQHRLERMEFDPKTFVDLDFFADRIGAAVDPALLLVGERNLGTVSDITPISRRGAFHAIMKYLVVGLGVYQGLEFLLERGAWELAGQSGVAISRLRNGLRLMSRSSAHTFVLGRDLARNTRTLTEFIERSLS